MSRQITQEDIAMIRYFIVEKDDIHRWCDWSDRKAAIQKEFPELIVALDNLSVAQRTLRRIVDSISQEMDDYPEA